MVDFEKHKIILLLMPTVTGFIKRQTPKKIISPPSKQESKLIDIFYGANKITDCLKQLDFTVEMLSGYRKSVNEKMNRHDYIVFMIENYYLRITSIFDRALRFSNLVFEIGIPEKECRESTIIKNDKIKGTSVEIALKEINKFINNYKQIRNQIAHNETFEDKELSPIRNFLYITETGIATELEKYKNIVKVMAEDYIADKKIELKKSTEDIKKLTSDFFDSVVPFIELSLKEIE